MLARYSHGRNLAAVIGAVVLFVAALRLLPVEDLPDYLPYQQIYELEGENFIESATDKNFARFVSASNQVGLNYVEFRVVVLSICLLAFLGCSVVLSRYGAVACETPAEIRASWITRIIIVFSLVVFFLEFYVIRIRAGLAIGLCLLAFSLFLTAPRLSLARAAVVGALLVIGLGTHGFTTMVLAYLLFIPLLYGASVRMASSQLGVAGRVLTGSSTFVVSMVIVLSASRWAEGRGEHLSSPLNTVRLLAIAAVPIGLAAVSATLREAAARLRAPVQSARMDAWGEGAISVYLFLAGALLLLAVLGGTRDSGEAMVRIFTLSSVPAICALLLGTRRHRLLWTYLLLCNALFFLNTLASPFRE